MSRNILIIAGEVSGDLHGAALISELKKLDDKLQFYGVGGDRMKDEGLNIIYHLNKMAFLGFAEVLKHLPFIKKVQRDLLQLVKEKDIKNVILIDYPGFNLSIAKKLKKNKINLIYYISPQLWAWGAGRVKKIKKLIDKMIVVFPFEKDFYKEAGIDAEYVGHPLIERIKEYPFLSRDEFFNKFKLDKAKDILLLLPGSRQHEIENIFPESIKAAERISNEFNMQIIIAAPSNITEESLRKLTGVKEFKVIKSHNYDLMKYAKAGIIKSGTSTLEAGLFELPMLVVYKTSYLTYLIGKTLVRIKNIGMVNIISGEQVVPELIQNEVSEDSIYSKLKEILSNEEVYSGIVKKLKIIKQKLGTEGASARAADTIYRLLAI